MVAVVMFVCVCVDKVGGYVNAGDMHCVNGSMTQIQLEDRIRTLQELIVNSNIGPPQQRQFKVRQQDLYGFEHLLQKRSFFIFFLYLNCKN